MIIMVTVGIVFAIVQEVVYLWYNKKMTKKYREEAVEVSWLYVP